MKIVPDTNSSVVKDANTAQLPVKVCLHVLREVHTDYRALRTATTLVQAGYMVSILDVESKRRLPREENIEGIDLKHMIISNWHTSRCFQPWFFLTAVRTFILSICGLLQSRADIYHVLELTALPAGYIVAKLRRKPLIYEAYELHLPVPETNVPFWRPLGGLLMRLLAVLLPRCAGVITTTPLYAEEYRKRFHLSEVTLLRNIPVYRTVQKTDRLRQHLGLSPDTRIVLYQGNLQRNRGLDKVVQAAAFLERDIVIVMMGKGMGTTQKELEALIASLGVADRVKIIPPVPRYEDVLDWTASADIGLILYTPNYSLAVKLILPNKLFEYIMAGVPVLATQLDAVVDVIRTYNVGQVVSSVVPMDIAAAINTMLADPAALAHMSRNALEAARRELHWEKESQQLIHLYQSVM